MVRVDEMLDKERVQEDAYLLLQVHDELVFEIRTARLAALNVKIQDIMESVLPPEETRGVPILVTMKTGSKLGRHAHHIVRVILSRVWKDLLTKNVNRKNFCYSTGDRDRASCSAGV